MTNLSVNINKIATLRNARGGNVPDLVKVAIDCQQFGAQGITVHPRPDERHIRYKDVFDLRPVVHTEFNIEGYPSQHFVDLVIKSKPEQVTLVPDPPDAITSNAGWDTIKFENFLKDIISEFHKNNIRTSIFVETADTIIENAAKTGTDRVELYTEPYATQYPTNKAKAVEPFRRASEVAFRVGLGLNSGHDLSLINLKYFVENTVGLLEVSIGHALISDALYWGLENSIQMYRREIENANKK